ncbi:MAG TPA: response regulator [Burkholderiales bacterium]|nr:response regulator [Burkholderiales bacterium]
MEILDRNIGLRRLAPGGERPAHVLVIDDQESTRLLLAHIVSRHPNTRVVLAGTCEQALQLAAATTYDLILLDLMMPGIGGFEVLRRLRVGSTNRWTPVVVVSALDDREAKLRCKALGANGFVAKPIARADIVAALRAHSAQAH